MLHLEYYYIILIADAQHATFDYHLMNGQLLSLDILRTLEGDSLQIFKVIFIFKYHHGCQSEFWHHFSNLQQLYS